MKLYILMHFRGLRLGEVPNTQKHHGKNIGTYTTEIMARDAIVMVGNQPGFDDHRDGYRLFVLDVDRTYWREGFRKDVHGVDDAIADDGSGVVGNDDGVEMYADDTERDFEMERRYMDNEALFDPATQVWSVEHFKISRLSSQCHEDMGHKLVGLYSTRAKAAAAMDALRQKSGFKDWPDGFRVERETLDSLAWERGFVSE